MQTNDRPPYSRHGYYAYEARAAVLARVEIMRLLKRNHMGDKEWQRCIWWGDRLRAHQIRLCHGRDEQYWNLGPY